MQPTDEAEANMGVLVSKKVMALDSLHTDFFLSKQRGEERKKHLFHIFRQKEDSCITTNIYWQFTLGQMESMYLIILLNNLKHIHY